MAQIPVKPYRQTKHKKPRYQLYIPGFNPGNGCWLEGDWITVPKDEYESRLAKHKKLFGKVAKQAAKQHYRGKGVPLDKLTEAQQIAYEHFSGDLDFSGLDKNGQSVMFRVRMAGNKPKPDQLGWMRENGYRVYRQTKNSYSGEVSDQIEGIELPDEFIIEGDPVDPWEGIIEQNKQRDMGMFNAMLESADPDKAGEGLFQSYAGFSARMAIQGIVKKEESIIRSKWDKQRGKKNPYDDIDRDVREYVDMRQRAKEVFGEKFEPLYEAIRASHNSCARSNLGDHGLLYCFILPKFNEDGTHEPWGERDVPWGVKD